MSELDYAVWRHATHPEEVAAMAIQRAQAFTGLGSFGFGLDAHDRRAVHVVALLDGLPVGAMRLGFGAELATHGDAGFFTHTFWRLDPALERADLVELSRVWLAPGLSGTDRARCLAGLWVEASAQLAEHRGVVFGTVSLLDWAPAAVQSVADYLAAHHACERWLEPHAPALARSGDGARFAADPRGVARRTLKAELEAHDLSLPPLLSFYCQQAAWAPGDLARSPCGRKAMVPVAVPVKKVHAHARRMSALARRQAA